ncbi:MAG: ABC transporter permease, partial [Opitutaceae bacterium]
MLLSEILRMAFRSLGVNKLRSFLTMSGITIGVFSVIGVMTTVSAMRGSIETGLSFLGVNMFQIGKYPNGIQLSGEN